MKKFIAILLALTLVFALASCKKDNAPAAVDVESYKTAVANTSLRTAKLVVTQTNDLFPNDPLVAEYEISFNDDGSAVVDFTYMLYQTITPGGDGVITEQHTGHANIAADGTVTGDRVSDTVTAAASVSFNLDATKMTVSEDHGILRANIPAANTAAVLGGAISADVVLTLSTANGVVTGATINYTTANASYEIVCTYNVPLN